MKATAGSRYQVGASFSIELHGINWAVLDGEEVICMVRGRSEALRIATKQQRQFDEQKKTVYSAPGAPQTQKAGGGQKPPVKPAAYPAHTDESGVKYHIEKTP